MGRIAGRPHLDYISAMPDRPLKALDARERLATRVWGIGFALLYWIGRTEAHSLDAISYARTVRDGAWADLFHPHHLAYSLVIKVLWNALQVIHPHLDPLAVAGFLNSLLAGLALAIFARCLLENGATFFWTSFATLGLGLSQCTWTLASENEVYVATLLLLIASARQALRAARTGRADQALQAGMLVAAASLFHVVAALFLVPVLLVAFRAAPDAPRRRRLLGAAALGAVVPAVAAYLVVMAVRHDTSVALATAWLNRYMRWDSWVDRDPVRLLLGFLWFLRGAVPDFGLIGNAPPPTAVGWLNDLARVPFLLFAGAVGYLAWDGWRKRPYLTWRFGALPVMCLAWFLVFELFLGWVGRSSLKFWTLTLPPLWAFTAIWADLRFGDPEGLGARRMSPVASVVSVLILALMVLTTGFLVVARRHDTRLDLPRRWSEAVARSTAPRDFLLVPEGDLEGYLLYYGRRGNLETLESLARSTRSLPATLDSLRARATRARAAGGRAWFLGTGLVVTPFAAQLWNRPEDAREVYRALEAELTPHGVYDPSARLTGPDGPLGQPVLLEWAPRPPQAPPAPGPNGPPPAI
ncbi:MAG: hypothetical protein HZB25_05815 [Candidatus Eisenbacteria bacterium]|nr:hypothetical protein [Candidatus Eisenbacteria bacterium]